MAKAKLLPLDAAAKKRVAAVLDGAAIKTLRSPAELHYAARSWNWDDGVAKLAEIIERDDCALATASLVFWNGTPDEIIAVYKTRKAAIKDDRENGAVFDLQLRICERVAAGEFQTHDIGYDPRDHNGTDLIDEWDNEEIPHPLPSALLAAVPGRLQDPNIRF